MREYINQNTGHTYTHTQKTRNRFYERYVIGLSNFPNVTETETVLPTRLHERDLHISFASLQSPLPNAYADDGTAERGVLYRRAIIHHGVRLRTDASRDDRRRNYCVLQRELAKAALTACTRVSRLIYTRDTCSISYVVGFAVYALSTNERRKVDEKSGQRLQNACRKKRRCNIE